MTFLDTNAFYYSADISYNPTVNTNKLKAYIKTHKMALSVISLHEFFVKYRSDINVIKKGFSFLSNNEFTVAYNKYFDAKGELGTDVLHMSEDDLGKYVNLIIDKKVEAESYFAWLLYSLIVLSAYCFFLETSEISFGKLEHTILEMCKDIFLITCRNEFKNYFIQGYESKNCNKLVYHEIDKKINDTLCKSFSFFDQISQCTSMESIMTVITSFPSNLLNEQKYSDQISEYDNSILFLRKLTKLYKNKKGEKEYKEFLEGALILLNNSIFDKSLNDYLFYLVDNCCTRGCTIMKNDILDSIIICGIEDNYKLITFDKKMNDFLEQYNTKYKTYSESIDLINQMKK